MVVIVGTVTHKNQIEDIKFDGIEFSSNKGKHLTTKNKRRRCSFLFTCIFRSKANKLLQIDVCVSLQFYNSYNPLNSHQMDIKLPPHLMSFILAVKRYLSQQRLSLDDFLSDFNLTNPSRMSQKDITRIV